MKERFENFIKKAIGKYGDKYDYSKVEYVNSKTKICIICLEHGEFWITPRQHLGGRGCTKCAKNGKKNTEEFVELCNEIHNNKYDYSKVEYVNAHTKVCIICPIHGEFWQSPNAHKRGQGCPKCFVKAVKKKKYDIKNIIQGEKEFSLIKKLSKIHNHKYDYSNFLYRSYRDEICIICPIHGEFWQRLDVHSRGGEYPKCSKQKINSTSKISLSNFIERAKKVHGDRYDYSKVRFNNIKEKICIICPIHGEFWQEANSHLHGSNCPVCGKESGRKKLQLSQEEFIKRVKTIHGDRYDYSKVEYKNLETPICIICPIHGEFWQKPSVHLQTKGCPLCKMSKLEMEMKTLLENYNIQYVLQYSPSFLHVGRKIFKIDFYIPQYNIAIECQGEQHFKPCNFGSKHITKDEHFLMTLENDKLKYKLCVENGIDLIYYSKKDNSLPQTYMNTIFTNQENIIQYIKQSN